MRKRELKNVEWSLLIVAIILCTIGLVALFSATQSTDYDEFNKQCIWLIVSLVIMGAIMLIDYEKNQAKHENGLNQKKVNRGII